MHWDITCIASTRCAPRSASGEGRRYYDLSRVRGPGGAAPLLRWLLRPVLLRLRADHERRVRAPNRCVDRLPYGEPVYIGKAAQPAEIGVEAHTYRALRPPVAKRSRRLLEGSANPMDLSHDQGRRLGIPSHRV